MSESRRCPQCQCELTPDVPGGLCPDCMLRMGIEGDPSVHAATMDLPSGSHPGGFAPPSIADLAPHFPDLEIIQLLGQGGMGAVYKARQRKLDRYVALKVLPSHLGQDPGFVERFMREALALAKLNHPNIVSVYDFDNKDGLCYFIMEYVDGVNLRQSIQMGRLSAEEALAIVPQICDALQFAHEEGIVHRDIKPENVLLDSKGRVKIADFGLAKLVGKSSTDRQLTISHQVMGTMHYMAPEQLEKPLQVDHRADIYSLGVVFYELLTGELPLGRFDPPSEKANVATALDQVVMRTLEKEPDRRYQHVSEVKTEVERASEAPYHRPAAEPAAERFVAGPTAKDAPHKLAISPAETMPNIGQFLMGAVMMLLGLYFLYLGLRGGNVDHTYFWIGFGITLGGGGTLSSAVKPENRLPAGTQPDSGSIIMGIVMVCVGVLCIALPYLQGRAIVIGDPMLWIGFGIAMGGGGCFASAWKKEVEKSELVEPPGDPAWRIPGGFMLAAGIINCTVPATVPLFRLLLVGVGALESGQAAYPPLTFPLALLIWAPAIPIGILMIVGGSSLVRRREGGVVVGIVASMIPLTPLFPVTLFIGIWSLLVFLLPPKDSEAKPLSDHEMAEAQQRVAGPAGGLLLIVSLYIVMIAIGVVAVFMLSLG